MQNEAKEWLLRARSNLEHAKRVNKEDLADYGGFIYFEELCFDLQQSAEKFSASAGNGTPFGIRPRRRSRRRRVLGPLVGLGQQHPPRKPLIDVGAEGLEELMGLGQVLATGPLPLVQIGDGVEPHPVHPEAEPEIDDGNDLRRGPPDCQNSGRVTARRTGASNRPWRPVPAPVGEGPRSPGRSPGRPGISPV